MSDDAAGLAALLPGYELGAEVGRGGFGTVRAAEHRRLGRRVAVKQLPGPLASDELVRRRFVTEARVLAALDHPHVVPVHDFVEDDGHCVLVLGLLRETLWERHEASALSIAEACATGIAACAALDYAHAHGVLHRDVKPTNLMFSDEGVLKVVDFGIAKVVGGETSVATAAGQVLGSPAYMAPEQVTGAAPSAATDVYALATVLYEVFSGRLPFSVDSEVLALLAARVREQPTPLAEVAAVPDALATVIMQGLAREPEARPDGALAFGVGLAQAATAGLGFGWLTEAGTPVYATGRLLEALEGARRDEAPPPSGVLLPGPKGMTGGGPGSPLPSSRLADLRPVHELVEAGLAGGAVAAGAVPSGPSGVSDPSGPSGLSGGSGPSTTPGAAGATGAAGPPAPSATVEISEPDAPPRTATIQGTTVFGRRNAGVVLADQEVSRRHFQLVVGPGPSVVVEDLGSTNGTALAGRLVDGPTVVPVGAVLEAGACRIRLVAVEQPAAAGPSPRPEPPRLAATVEVGGLRLRIPADPEGRLGWSADLLVGLATAAWDQVVALGLADQLAEPVAVEVLPSLVADGVMVDHAARALRWPIGPELPPEPLAPALAALAGRRLPAGRVLDVVALGLGLAAAGLPDPAPGLRDVELPASVPDARGGVRVAMARSFAGFLLARVGEEGLRAFLRAGPPPDFHDRARALLGATLPDLEQEWRSILTSIPAGGVLAGPLLATTAARVGDARAAIARVGLTGGLAPATVTALVAAATDAHLASGSRSAEGRWIAAVASGRARLVVATGPLAGTVVAELGPGASFGAASAVGRPHGLVLEAIDGVELVVVDDAAITAAGLPPAEPPSTGADAEAVRSWAVALDGP